MPSSQTPFPAGFRCRVVGRYDLNLTAPRTFILADPSPASTLFTLLGYCHERTVPPATPSAFQHERCGHMDLHAWNTPHLAFTQPHSHARGLNHARERYTTSHESLRYHTLRTPRKDAVSARSFSTSHLNLSLQTRVARPHTRTRPSRTSFTLRQTSRRPLPHDTARRTHVTHHLFDVTAVTGAFTDARGQTHAALSPVAYAHAFTTVYPETRHTHHDVRATQTTSAIPYPVARCPLRVTPRTLPRTLER